MHNVVVGGLLQKLTNGCMYVCKELSVAYVWIWSCVLHLSRSQTKRLPPWSTQAKRLEFA